MIIGKKRKTSRKMQSILIDVAMNIQVITQNYNNSILYEFEESLEKASMDEVVENWWQKFFNTKHLLEDVSVKEIVFRSFGAFLCLLIVLTTLVGNILVIVVVTRFHRMRTVTNILLASLAFSDITVACLQVFFISVVSPLIEQLC
ncbi:unnamed protein product [Medioppia subpectinata]|uniref:G-protein coupled receptors family 1 profile domain-containing protein n=1 Tax=Medioppia subpectinata TaxID=1979941 RepID=A0A7R9KVR0_9ACAR|nr:unnamed protein product [Medioppia subpectinata]CAG2110373.1 unnamed protein product [Medioppia subpectinata]